MIRKSLLVWSLTCAAWAVEVQPVIKAELLMGQYWYNGADSKIGGVTSLSASPYLKFNDRWSVVPLYQGRYQGTKQVSDFSGGGTLFQDSQSHHVSVKGIRSFSHGLKLKAIGGYGIEWLRETTDEDWTKGLYDNRRLSAGVEGEWSWAENESLRFGYDHYRIRFPNYASLESQAGANLGRELAQPNVLDNINHRLNMGFQKVVFGRGLVEAGMSQTFRTFSDQHIVAESGNLKADTRNDSVQSLTLQGTWPLWAGESKRLISALAYGWTQVFSDQNSYDAGKTRFLPNYYAYVQQSLSNHWALLVGDENPWSINFITTLGRQGYRDRPQQDSVGNYGASDTQVDFLNVGLGFGYPIAKGFQLRGQVDLGWSDSNNTYSQVYQYHYHTASYLVGFSYAY